MSKLVTLDEVEAYDSEKSRAHAENRAPMLRNPHEVFADNLGNAESHLEELSGSEVSSATTKLHKDQKAALKDDERLVGIIRDNSNKLSDGSGAVLPYAAPDPDRHNPAESDEEKEALGNAVQHNYERNREFDDSFSDSNIPNLTDDGQVKGDSVNLKFTRKQPTFDPDELVRANEANSVPVPERYKQENPPQVIQQSNPFTGESPHPETTGYVEGYVSNNTADEDDNGGVYDASDVPLTAITTPWPENVIGDETGTTREPTRENETDVNSPEDAPKVPLTVPLSEGQVLQGAVKRPDHFNPPSENVSDTDLSQAAHAGTVANLPVDTTGLRGDNAAHKAAVEITDDSDTSAREYLSPGNSGE